MSANPENASPGRQDPLAFYLDKSDPDTWQAVGVLRRAAMAAAKDAGLDLQLIELVFLRVFQINGCAFCLNTHLRAATKAGVSPQRMTLLPAWRDAEDVYSPLERAALALAEAVTELPEHEELQVAQLMSHAELTDAQYAAVQWLAIVMNVTNRVSILSHHPVARATEA
ncbi:MAG: carboxymuconolactone decarboxylase family protein [Micrococcus sp.]|nr:carboxymuconolactone decarboxylase family protein [Micrococcus sp.]